jgi:predicted RNA binding protein YcfA (HicA-like mRNA interferase family)
MSKIPHLKPDRVIRAIKRAEFEIEEGTRHTMVIKDDQIVTMIPRGSKVLKKGTLSGIIKDLGMTLEEFKSYL